MSMPRSLIAPAVFGLLACAGLAAGAGDAAVPAVVDPNPGATPIDPEVLYLRTGEIRLPEMAGGLEALATPALREGEAPVYYVIQLRGPMTPARREALTAAGVTLGDYLPANAYIARFDGADAERLAAIDFVRWHGVYQRAWKIDPEVGRKNFQTPERQALAAEDKTVVVVTLFDGVRPPAVAKRIAALEGAEIHGMDVLAGNGYVTATVRLADVPAIAAMSEVQFIEEGPEVTERSNSNNRWVVQTNLPGVTPFYEAGIHGEGQIVGILDSRIRPDHCSFSDTVPVGPDHRKLLALNAGSGTAGSHGTHVAGTVAGDSGTDNDLRGVAYLARIVHDVYPSPLNGPQTFDRLTTHHNQGARVHTNSWGNDATTAYDALCRAFDEFLWLNEDSMVTLAVTNQSSLKNPENAKNLLACGATDPVPNQASHCYGGTGPTTDLRRKPEIYAPGCSTVSASSSTTCGTSTSSGTSMATPAVAGAALLARQYFTDGFYPGGVLNPSDGFVPSGALVKAALLNSTVDMTGVPGFPSNQEGWGRVLLDNTFYFANGSDSRRMVVFDVRNAEGLSTGGVAEHTINVLSSSEPLSITLTWTEPPAAAGASVATVNNLDLVVTAPDGTMYLGNVFAGGESTTGGSPDARNNVEQVRISAPIPGSWTVSITGTAVNESTQGYALVASGDVQTGPASLSIAVAAPRPSLVEPGQSVDISVNINPGGDEVVPGSAVLSYRFSSDGPFTTIPLTHVSENTYTATIPAARCGDTPQYFASVEGVNGGVRTSPLNAPTNVFSYAIGTTTVVTLVDESFDTLPAGWTTTGLWHIQSACAVTPTCGGTSWIAYNSDGTCNYNTGATNSGDLITAPITIPEIPADGTVTLSYCYTLQTENATNWDLSRIYIGETIVDDPPESPNAWTTREVDLRSFAGQTVTLRFNFDTRDSTANNFRGWQVDNVRIIATTMTCSASCAADFNGDNVVNSTDVSAFLAQWLVDVSQGVGVTDINRDGVVNSADISAFLTVWLAGVNGEC